MLLSDTQFYTNYREEKGYVINAFYPVTVIGTLKV